MGIDEFGKVHQTSSLGWGLFNLGPGSRQSLIELEDRGALDQSPVVLPARGPALHIGQIGLHAWRVARLAPKRLGS